MNNDVIKNVSTLTTISEKTINKLLDKFIYCINDAIADAMLTNNTTFELDIGLGTLIIVIIDNSIKYRFVPSAKLNDSVRDTIVNKQNILEDVLEASLVDKIINTYKDLI